MSHSTSSMVRMKNPTQGLSKIITIVDDPRDMNHLDNILLFPILDLEIGSFNMACTVGRMTSIDNVDTGFIVFINYCSTSRRLPKAVKDMANIEIDFSSRNSSTTSNTLDFLWTPSTPQARRLFV